MSFRLWYSKLIHCLEKGWDSFVLVASQCRFSIWPFVVSAAQSWRRGGNLLEAGSSLVRWMLGESDSRKLVANEYQASPTNQPTRGRSGCQQRWRPLQKSRKLWNLSARPHLQASMEFAGKRGLVNLLLKFLVMIWSNLTTSPHVVFMSCKFSEERETKLAEFRERIALLAEELEGLAESKLLKEEAFLVRFLFSNGTLQDNMVLIMSHSQMLGKFEYGLPAKFWRLVGCTEMLSW